MMDWAQPFTAEKGLFCTYQKWQKTLIC
jgi:hypothetical protein